MDLEFLSACTQAELVRTRQVSPIELVQCYLDRIDRLNPVLRAYVTVMGEEALSNARAAETAVLDVAPEDLPPFHGVPISIKDITPVAGVRNTYSSKIFADNIPDHDAAVVRRFREAGLIILGKTNVPEFAMGLCESELNGICRNPWNLNLSPSGSSGGAASALAAGLCAVSHGNDGGGSIRLPASFCGLVGLKPSRGRVSWAPDLGDLAVMGGLTTEGVLTHKVEDAAALLDVMAGYETGDPYWAPVPGRPFRDEVIDSNPKLRIAFTAQPPNEIPIHPECVKAVETTAELLESLGHVVENASPQWDCIRTIQLCFKVYSTLPALLGVEERDFPRMEPRNRLAAEAAVHTSSSDFVKALNELQRFARNFISFWNDYDVWVTPTACVPPVPIGDIPLEAEELMEHHAAKQVAFTCAINASGQPAMTLPLHWTSDNLPIGVQIVGRPADESTLLGLARQLEEAQPWTHRVAPVS